MCGFSGSRLSALSPTWLLIPLGLALPVRPAEAQVVGQRFQDCPVCPEMVVVPAGSFMMGSPPSRRGRGYKNTAPVGSFRPNAFGLHDVLGNVWEWTEDCWNGDYSGAPVDGSAWRAGDCSNRVLRGGDWILWPTNLRAGFRLPNRAGFRFFHFGFRVARTMD